MARGSSPSKPIKTEPPTNWTMRWIVGLVVAPTFVFSAVYFPPLFAVFALIMNTVALHEFYNCISCIYSDSNKKSSILKYLVFVIGNAMILSSGISPKKERLVFILMLALPILIVYSILRGFFSHQSKLNPNDYGLAISSFMGLAWISFGLASLVSLAKSKPSLALLSILMTVFSDSTAMLIGRPFGKHHMYTALSPKKTWEGFLGGVFVGALVFMLFLYFPFRKRWSAIPSFSPLVMFLLCCVLGFLCQLGDLMQSYIKRIAVIKESGVFFPGHGGALDRICSALFESSLLFLASDFLFSRFTQ